MFSGEIYKQLSNPIPLKFTSMSQDFIPHHCQKWVRCHPPSSSLLDVYEMPVTLCSLLTLLYTMGCQSPSSSRPQNNHHHHLCQTCMGCQSRCVHVAANSTQPTLPVDYSYISPPCQLLLGYWLKNQPTALQHTLPVDCSQFFKYFIGYSVNTIHTHIKPTALNTLCQVPVDCCSM